MTDTLIEAWIEWDNHPREERTASALADAVQAQANEWGVSSVWLRKRMTAKRRQRIPYTKAIAQLENESKVA